MPVVAHHDDDRVVAEPEGVDLVEDLADPAVELLHALDVGAAVGGRVPVAGRAGVVERDDGPVLEEEGLALRGELAQVLQCLALEAVVHLVVLRLGPAFAGLHVHLAHRLAPPAFDDRRHVGGVRSEPLVHGEPVVVVVLADADGDLLVGGVVVEDGQLALLVDGEGGVVEALVVGPGLLDVAHVPLADVHGVVA